MIERISSDYNSDLATLTVDINTEQCTIDIFACYTSFIHDLGDFMHTATFDWTGSLPRVESFIESMIDAQVVNIREDFKPEAKITAEEIYDQANMRVAYFELNNVLDQWDHLNAKVINFWEGWNLGLREYTSWINVANADMSDVWQDCRMLTIAKITVFCESRDKFWKAEILTGFIYTWELITDDVYANNVYAENFYDLLEKLDNKSLMSALIPAFPAFQQRLHQCMLFLRGD